MSATVLYGGEPISVASAAARGDDLWLSLDELRAGTGWDMKPQGVCREERCVPIPSERKGEFIDADRRFNLAAFARYLEQPLVHDATHDVWVFGVEAATRRDALLTRQAPDFRLPDLDGSLHALSDFRGRKVLLLSWASW